jgi:ribosomal protein S18 acetylase RimI-like enzyme
MFLEENAKSHFTIIIMCRKKESKDLDRIAEIWHDNTIEVHPFVDKDPKRFWYGRIKDFKEEARTYEGYVYPKNGEVQGFIIYSFCNGHVYIYDLYVHKKYRSNGIGTKLLNQVKKIAKPNPITLHVYALNLSAIQWYYSKGFIIIQPYLSNTLRREISDLQKCQQKNKEVSETLKYKQQQLKYLLTCSNYCGTT